MRRKYRNGKRLDQELLLSSEEWADLQSILQIVQGQHDRLTVRQYCLVNNILDTPADNYRDYIKHGAK